MALAFLRLGRPAGTLVDCPAYPEIGVIPKMSKTRLLHKRLVRRLFLKLVLLNKIIKDTKQNTAEKLLIKVALEFAQLVILNYAQKMIPIVILIVELIQYVVLLDLNIYPTILVHRLDSHL